MKHFIMLFIHLFEVAVVTFQNLQLGKEYIVNTLKNNVMHALQNQSELYW